jgi:hypothetical protein
MSWFSTDIASLGSVDPDLISALASSGIVLQLNFDLLAIQSGVVQSFLSI